MSDLLITVLLFAALALAVLMAVGVLMMWGTLVSRFVRWLLPRSRAPLD
jgi:hypothetical protein